MKSVMKSVVVNDTTEMSPFAQSVFDAKYAWKNADGEPVENWAETAWRVATNVLGALDIQPGSDAHQRVDEPFRERKLMPGGRYLYASGRDPHQVQNCLLLQPADSRGVWPAPLSTAAIAHRTAAGGASV